MKTRILTVGILAAVLMLGLLAPATAQSPVSEFDTILADRVVATDNVTAPDVTVSDDLTVTDAATVGGALGVTGATTMAALNATGNATFGGTLAVTGAAAFATKVNIVPQTAITVTNAAVFTPTGSLQLIQAAGGVSPVLASGSSGQVVTLLNISNQTITIADTTGQLLSAAGALGQWDTLTLVWYGTSWIELARSNN